MEVVGPEFEPRRIEAELREQRIRRLAVTGIPPEEIGWRVGMSRAEVVAFLDGTPAAVERHRPDMHAGDSVHPMWTWPDSDRRRAFWERQRKGARATLQGKYNGR